MGWLSRNAGKNLPVPGRGEFVLDSPFHRTSMIAVSQRFSPSTHVKVRWTFPLSFAEIVWGDGAQTYRTQIPLDTTRQFGSASFEWKAEAKGWKWARVAVWDIAGNGAFVNPVWRAP